MKTDSAQKVLENIQKNIKSIYGFDLSDGKIKNVASTQQQKIERKVQQANAFLDLITVRGVRDSKGNIISFNRPGTLRQRTSAQNESIPAFGKRRPVNPTVLGDRSYECHNFESDPVLDWDVLDSWSHIPEFYAEYLNSITLARATDILSVMWNGQYKAANTDRVANPLLEDDQPGIFQYLYENAPEKILGVTPNPASPGGYDVDPIYVGKGAGANGFETLDSLVFHMKNTMIAKQFRTSLDLRAIIGDELLYRHNTPLYDGSSVPGTGIDESTERMAREVYIKNQLVGSLQKERSDQFPERGLIITPTSNICRYYQLGSMRRQMIEDHNQKGVVDYLFGRDDYVLENLDMACAVHPDAIYLKNPETGNFEPMSEAWKKVAA